MLTEARANERQLEKSRLGECVEKSNGAGTLKGIHRVSIAFCGTSFVAISFSKRAIVQLTKPLKPYLRALRPDFGRRREEFWKVQIRRLRCEFFDTLKKLGRRLEPLRAAHVRRKETKTIKLLMQLPLLRICMPRRMLAMIVMTELYYAQ
jgi:hypothetical protein